jgi:aspartate/methionine/tyrosine aminotransferase
MPIQPFKLERYFAKYEFDVPYLLSSSDSEPITVPELLTFATDERRAQWENLSLGYTESKGHPDLLNGIAAMYADNIAPENVIELVPEEGIYIAMQTLLSRGDHLISTAPGYQSLYEVARSNGCEISLWMPNAENGWHFDIDALESLITPKTRMIAVNFPHNPTGYMPTHADFERIIAIARKNDIILFSDEMYRFFEYDSANRLPAAGELYENAISLCGLSKSFGMPGARVGWLITQNAAFMAQFQQYKDYTTICSSAPSEILGIIAVEAHEQLAARNLEIVNANLAVLDDFFVRWENLLRWQRPIAGTITFAEILRDVDIQSIADELVTSKGVMILPSLVYDYPGNYFRLGFGRRNLPQVLAKFEEFLGERF